MAVRMIEQVFYELQGFVGATSGAPPPSHSAMEQLRSLAIPTLRILFLVLLAALLIYVLFPAALAAQGAAAV